MRISSSVALVIYFGVMLIGFIFKTIFKDAPYETLAINITLGFGGYLTKRTWQKKFPTPETNGSNQ